MNESKYQFNNKSLILFSFLLVLASAEVLSNKRKNLETSSNQNERITENNTWAYIGVGIFFICAGGFSLYWRLRPSRHHGLEPLFENDQGNEICCFCRRYLYVKNVQDVAFYTPMTLPCSHKLHTGCLTILLQNSKHCPICRQAVIQPKVDEETGVISGEVPMNFD